MAVKQSSTGHPSPKQVETVQRQLHVWYLRNSQFPGSPHVPLAGGRCWGRGYSDNIDCAHTDIHPSSPAGDVLSGTGQASPYSVLVTRTGTRCAIRPRQAEAAHCSNCSVGRNCLNLRQAMKNSQTGIFTSLPFLSGFPASKFFTWKRGDGAEWKRCQHQKDDSLCMNVYIFHSCRVMPASVDVCNAQERLFPAATILLTGWEESSGINVSIEHQQFVKQL